MRRRQYAPKPAQDTSVLSSEKLLQTRPFQPEIDNNLQVPSMQASAQPMSGGWDLTKKVFVDEPQRPQTLGPPLQAKLTIGEPNDKYEQEADRVAKQVVQRLSLGGGELSASDKDERTQPNQTLQRETLPDEEDELQMKPLLQRKGSGDVAASDDLESAIHQSRGGGQPLADSIREPMEQAFGGVDFSGVKVHTNAQSDQLNRSIQAKAFTTGQDVFFRRGAYAPGSRGGQELIAHELTHVVQQNGGAVMRSIGHAGEDVNVPQEKHVQKRKREPGETNGKYIQRSYITHNVEGHGLPNGIGNSTTWEAVRGEAEDLHIFAHWSLDREEASGRFMDMSAHEFAEKLVKKVIGGKQGRRDITVHLQGCFTSDFAAAVVAELVKWPKGKYKAEVARKIIIKGTTGFAITHAGQARVVDPAQFNTNNYDEWASIVKASEKLPEAAWGRKNEQYLLPAGQGWRTKAYNVREDFNIE